MLSLAVNQRDPEEVRVALHQGSQLVDLRWARNDRPTLVGNIYLATVRQVESGLDAAFVDFGERRAGFLHKGNVHPSLANAQLAPFEVAGCPSRQAAELTDDPGEDGAQQELESELQRAPQARIDELLRPGQKILVQVLRDPVRGKGATLTTILSIPGRQTVLVPSLGRVGVSRKINDMDQRQRLRELIESELAGTSLGAIARTASAESGDDDVRDDLAPLLAGWAEIGKRAKDADSPELLFEEAGPTTRAVRELLTQGVARVLVDSPAAEETVRGVLQRYLPKEDVTVELYRRRRPLFEMLGLERDWQLLFRARVPVGGGASIVIHETEALTAVDVNSGRVDRGTLEETALATNLMAAEEIARQVRLRDIGGIIVADFIDMQRQENRDELESALREFLRGDRARLKVGRMSAFGLIPMTRRRQGAGLPRASESQCESCGGSGHRGHHHAGALRVLRRLRAIEENGPLRIRLHPGVYEALRRDFVDSVDDLGFDLEFEPDSQVPSGEPVVEPLAGSRASR